jgi:CubicO group peptidase (beta-lactamase class C family)
VALLVLLAGCAQQPQQGLSSPDPQAAQAQRIENGLRRLVRLESRPEETFSLAERMERHGVPGVGLAVIEDGVVAWSRGYGVLEDGGAVPVTEHSRFRACSLSKVAAAVGALSMVQDGELSLSDDVNEQLESWQVPENELTRTEKVTVERLLSHTAGLGVQGFDPYDLEAPLPTTVQILDGLPPAGNEPVRVVSVPGTEWSYSGGGYTVLEQLMVDVEGRPFEEILRRRVFGPLGMGDSSYADETSATPDVAVGHDGLGRPIEGRFGATPELAAAGLRTTARDYATLLVEILAAYRGEGRVLDGEMGREMLTARTGEWGLGPFVVGEGKDLRIGHGGIDHGYNSYAVAYPNRGAGPNRGQGVVIFTNGDRGNRVQEELLRAFAVELGWPDYQQIPKQDAEVDPALFTSYLGTYQVGDSWGFRIGQEGDTLVFFESDGFGARLVPQSERLFFDPEDGSEIEFVPAADGSVQEVVIRSQRGGGWTAHPVP